MPAHHGHRPDFRHVGPVRPDPAAPVAVSQQLVGLIQTARISRAVPVDVPALSIGVIAILRSATSPPLGAQGAGFEAAPAGRRPDRSHPEQPDVAVAVKMTSIFGLRVSMFRQDAFRDVRRLLTCDSSSRPGLVEQRVEDR